MSDTSSESAARAIALLARFSPAVLLLVIVCTGRAAADTAALDLAGTWQFRMDPDNEGVREGWFIDDLPDTASLPGSMAENGLGNAVTAETPWTGTVRNRMWHEAERFAPYREPGNVKILFWLQPDKHYVGPAWYRREVAIPEAWRGRRMVLFLERCHWETRVWLDGHYAGMRNSLSTPHEYDLTGVLEADTHTLAIRVDNTVKIDVGRDAHSVSDNTQTNWNGLVGEIALRATDPVWVEDVQVYPDVAEKAARVQVEVGNATGETVAGSLTVSARSWNGPREHVVPDLEIPVEVDGEGETIEFEYPLGEGAQPWSEFSPTLYRLTASLETRHPGGGCHDSYSVDFGLRRFAAVGTQFALNGKPIFLRGTLECCIFPLTGYPPTDIEAWLRVLRAARAHGLNHLRFHSWCPPEAAFEAADRMGFIYQVECAAWAKVGDGEAVDQFIYDEGDRILKAYGNHPSFCMLAYGNEPAGKRHKDFLAGLLEYWKARDSRRVYTGAAGWPILRENEFHCVPQPRVHAWGSGLSCRFNARPLETRTDYGEFIAQYDVPVVSHEIGQWCVFPNLDEIAKYTGVLKARNFEIVRDLLAANGMLDQAHDFLLASGKLQTLCYKEEIEAALRTPGMGGYQLLDLHDFPGQGTALVGVLDPFWDSKGYVTADEYRRFAGQTVPLLRMDKCVWTSDETFVGDVEIAHFGPEHIEGAKPAWRLADGEGREIARGEFPSQDIPVGNGLSLGQIRFGLDAVEPPQQLTVTVSLPDTSFTNTWDLWVYPPQVETASPDDVLATGQLDERAREALARGGKVLLLPAAGTVAGDERGRVPPGFSPIFWNTFWTLNQPPHTLGILCDPQHPALARFPTEFHSNWQWWDLVHGSQILILDGLPRELRPIVQVIDDWTTCRRLGLIVEAKVGNGKLLVCGADVQRDLETRPVARQMRHSLMAYMTSEAFDPAVNVTPDALARLFVRPSAVQRLGATATAGSQERGHEARNALDNNDATIWHTAWSGGISEYPHWIAVDLRKPVALRGVVVTPRQDMANGRIGRYAVYAGDDGRKWGKPVARGVLSRGTGRQELAFKKPRTGRFLKLEALAPIHPSHPWASLAELDVLLEED